MLKSELLESIKDIADDADINETVQAIDGLAKPFNVANATVDDYKGMLENNPIVKAYYQSSFDSAVGTAVTKHDEKFKKEKLPGLIEEAVKAKTNENLTPEQLKIKELEEKMQQYEAKAAEDERVKTNATKLKEKGLDTGLAKYIKEDSDIDFFENLVNTLVDSKVKEKLGDSAYKPPVGGQQGESWTLEQAMAYMNEHPDADINSVMAKVK